MHDAVAAHDFVVATPHELTQVEIVEAGRPHLVGQSGLHVTVPDATQTVLIDVADIVQAEDPYQETVSIALALSIQR